MKDQSKHCYFKQTFLHYNYMYYQLHMIYLKGKTSCHGSLFRYVKQLYHVTSVHICVYKSGTVCGI